ncbi:tRNAHis guanylyltransferase-domain-containing protein [Boeremia exigua]|uniref:tRNAHis guanylyltransferase-domain-containing protein n=1 Tax=Boeremia exigua TaxID=749465 RepID=UPI001E8CD496|nr:tRNAHis guanylyltransferase-domain-containing protein [Boeremia exigua]KAH6642836.1 tRNAHis guanylyltransferase-domain-containing protein [Boeremia exigua]
MANSKYEYVRFFEQPDILLSNTWIVVRIDGRGFSKLTTKYKFVKPNDRDALDLMNEAAEAVMRELPDLVIAYGNSDEYSFVFHKDCMLFERRASKLVTTIVSTFTSYYVFLWSKYFPQKPLTPPLPSFDGRAVCYPSDLNLRDYMSWRQVDCHINNLYNTTFWTLVQQGGMSPQEAEQRLSGTVSADKNEILFKEFGINYNNEPDCFKKGTILYRDLQALTAQFFPTEDPQAKSTAAAENEPSVLAQPQPVRSHSRPLSQAGNLTPSRRASSPVLPIFSSPTGPTFLSTASTPSPPPALQRPKGMGFPNPLQSNPVSPHNTIYSQNTMPLSPPSTLTSPTVKQALPSLMPLPLSPPILKPSTKPPQSLDAPNPTTRANFSPTAPPADFSNPFVERSKTQLREKPISHSASASMSTSGPSEPKLKHRSPSLSQIHTYLASSSTGPPSIPLRISSIPANTKPRKLSLLHLRSNSNLRDNSGEGKENAASSLQGPTTPPRSSPPLNTNKELPSPPGGDGRVFNDPNKRKGSTGWQYDEHPGIAELPANSARHSRQQSQPVPASNEWGSYAHVYDTLQSSVPGTQPSASTDGRLATSAREKSSSKRHAPTKSEVKSEKRKSKDLSKSDSKNKTRPAAADPAAITGQPLQMSRTQKEKDRKRRSKARIITEHVDLIKDDFWEKRPWILSGKAG